jgi:VWFA-related protein
MRAIYAPAYPVLILVASGLSFGQSSQPQSPPNPVAGAPVQDFPATQSSAANKNAPEIASHDTAANGATFSTRVNLVVAPVVVRDHKGRAIGTLTKDDFQLFDKGKLQVISRFTVEKAGEKAASEAAQLEATAAASGVEPSSGSAVIPTRFIAYLFDDVHISFGDLAQVRAATIKHFAEALKPTDRAAIFTTSGLGNLDFTDDRDQLLEALSKITPRSRSTGGIECPPMTLYMADLIFNHNDSTALNAAAQDAILCANLINVAGPTGGSSALQQAQNMAQSAASRFLAIGESELQQTLGVLRDVIRRMADSPGQRSLVLISPGFLVTTTYRFDESDLMDRAVRANVVISTLDARGLYTFDTGVDGSQGQFNSATANVRNRYQRDEALASEDVLGELADGTGGTFFHNNNDYKEGLQRTAAAPEYVYLLGFSPQNLKYDGTFHSLKIVVKVKDVSSQARRGYYAPKHAVDEAEQAKQEIHEALFSREELQEFPVTLQTQFFKPTPDTARVSILAHIDIKLLHFQKAEGRNHDTLTIVSALFDRNGNLINGVQKTLEMRLKEETLQDRLTAGIAVKTSFDTQPGKYLLRLVVRDSEGQMMAARNGIVDIP